MCLKSKHLLSLLLGLLHGITKLPFSPSYKLETLQCHYFILFLLHYFQSTSTPSPFYLHNGIFYPCFLLHPLCHFLQELQLLSQGLLCSILSCLSSTTVSLLKACTPLCYHLWCANTMVF